jgi:hypothetical protein
VLAAHPSPGPRDSEGEESGVKDLRDQPWWTPADRAELDAFAQRLVDAVHAHRAAGCEVCAAGYPPCSVVTEAVEQVVEWRDRRMLLSLATWLRARQEELEQAVSGRRT